ncbi:response regulator [Azospirillum sp. SYSU D00513]|uniref:response regulator n=1 Tax=Azospirillum sp. SYSU D00513 TaxID=2812561 RepID=UPI0032B3D622
MSKHIIVAEDEALVAMGFECFLQDAGYRVTLAQDGLEAIEAFRADPADLLLTDVRMPRLDGFGLISRIREIAPDLPVIVASGHTRPDSVNLDAAKAPTTLLMKPVSFQTLLDAVADALIGRRHAV